MYECSFRSLSQNFKSLKGNDAENIASATCITLSLTVIFIAVDIVSDIRGAFGKFLQTLSYLVG